MEMARKMRFESNSFGKRLKSMLAVDFRRMFTMPLVYTMVGICLVIPILILVMTTMMDGSVTVDPTTGVETVMEGFKNTWQAIGSLRTESAAMSMDLTGMCNINMMYFFAAVLVCLFVAEDFRSGYAKNLFTVRAKKSDYVISKTLVGFVGGALMLLAFFAGTCLGGAISGLPFDTGAAGLSGILMCMLAKIFLMAVFVSIDVAVSVAAKQKSWLSRWFLWRWYAALYDDPHADAAGFLRHECLHVLGWRRAIQRRTRCGQQQGISQNELGIIWNRYAAFCLAICLAV